MPTRRPIIGGNWKMNTNAAAAEDLAHHLIHSLSGELDHADAVLFPPFPYLLNVRSLLTNSGSTIRLGAQDFYHKPNGAFTGEVSLDMLRDCGVTDVLVGHSERRHVMNEPDELIRLKLHAALATPPAAAPLTAVLCIGETLDQRAAGLTDHVNSGQLTSALSGLPAAHLARLVIAYEPVWAIGTGKNATPADAQAAHAAIRDSLASLFDRAAADAVRIQYGGSLKPENARDIFAQPDVDGGLVGGASLNAEHFAAIVHASRR